MYCVIIGDIIGSRTLEPGKRQASTKAIEWVLDRINRKYEKDILASFGIVRGDAFEGVLHTQHRAPQIIQDMLMDLYGENVAVRISSAAGELTVISPERDKADGPAFYEALKGIEVLRKEESGHWFQVSMQTGSAGQPLVDGLLNLLSALTKGWTSKQANIVWSMLRCDNRQVAVSEKLKIAPSLVSKQLKAADFEAYQAAWSALEKYLLALEDRQNP